MTSRRLLTPAAKALLDAADYIEANGHNKGTYFKRGCGPEGPPPACAGGAIIKVADYDMDVVNAACDRLHKIVGHIPDWNDAPERTAEEVMAGLRSAAVDAEE